MKNPPAVSPVARLVLCASIIVVCSAALAAQGDAARYQADFEFLARTVKEQGAAVAAKKIDWDAACARFKPRFAACHDDPEAVRLTMEMLATLRDSHTGVTRSTLKDDVLPSKWQGLFGGGLWFGFEDGRFVLRGIMAGHPLANDLRRGSTLLAIGGEPAWLAMERERRRCAVFMGISTNHSFFGSLANRLLPFGERRDLACTFLPPEGKPRTLQVPRWGPGGHAFSPFEAFLPAGVPYGDGAVSKMLAGPGGLKIGYLKVTGSMDAPTVKAFNAAFDQLRGMQGLLLDCRMMGGGGDQSAWEMCGRLFSKTTPNGKDHQLAPSGSWQFDGPAVMLQDETEVSSAETFTWALSETGRVISVGRTTGGWGIIPRVFELPSGLASFRLGVNDRPTPVKGIHTEGVGWPADVTVPHGPVISAADDATREVGTAILACLAGGAALNETRQAFHALAEGDVTAFRTFARKVGPKAKGADLEQLAKLFLDDLKAEIAIEGAALAAEEAVVPDVAGAARRLPRLLARAKAAGISGAAADLEQKVKAARAEGLAQDEWLALAQPFAADAAPNKAWLVKHGKTRLGAFVREHLWK